MTNFNVLSTYHRIDVMFVPYSGSNINTNIICFESISSKQIILIVECINKQVEISVWGIFACCVESNNNLGPHWIYLFVQNVRRNIWESTFVWNVICFYISNILGCDLLIKMYCLIEIYQNTFIWKTMLIVVYINYFVC